jgi:hypothetical protein
MKNKATNWVRMNKLYLSHLFFNSTLQLILNKLLLQFLLDFNVILNKQQKRVKLKAHIELLNTWGKKHTSTFSILASNATCLLKISRNFIISA